jgi:pectate lyase
MSKHTRLAAVTAAASGLILAVTAVLASTSASAATLFADNFDDGNADGWSKSGGSWSVVTDGSPVWRQSGTSSDARALGGSTWADQSVQVRVKPTGFGASNRHVAVMARAQNTGNYYYLALTGSGSIELGKRVGGGLSTLASAPAAVLVGSWHTLRLEVFGTTLRGFLGNTQVVSATDSTFVNGRMGFATMFASASFDDVLVTDTPNAGVPPTTTTTVPPTPGTCDTSGRPVGFAAVNVLGQNGTTGGAGGPTVEVDTAAEFLGAIATSGPLNICVRGTIALPGPMHSVASDKSIIGVGSTAGFTGGGLNIGIPNDDAITAPPPNAVHNVVVRNLSFRNWPDDAINVQMFSHHVWLDHNDIGGGGFDGAIDIKRGSSYVTVSWNHTHNHTKNMLLGHDDGAGAQDIGRLKVTYHHNWFDQTPQRNPRVRFGEPVHVFNNYYLHNTDVGVACQANAGCLVEGNYFENTEESVTNHYAGPTGRCVARNNVLVGESGQPDCSGTVQEARDYYAYTLDDPNTVKSIVMAGSGVGHV